MWWFSKFSDPIRLSDAPNIILETQNPRQKNAKIIELA
jgi:hypothetical protein